MPFDFDEANPADDAIVSQFPANERLSRAQLEAWADFEHSKVSGRHKIPAGTVAARDSITDWEKGSMWINTDVSPNALQVQIGTPPAFAWADASGRMPGEIVEWAGSTEPDGWLFCYGQAISRTTFAALFAVVGTTYGVGDGSTTFNLPDLRGRVVAGRDNMGGVSANRLTDQGDSLDGDVLGDAGGTEVHALTIAQLPAHTHSVNDPSHVHQQLLRTSLLGGLSGSGGGWAFDGSAPVTASLTGISLGNTGSGVAHNNVQPTIILNKIIKT